MARHLGFFEEFLMDDEGTTYAPGPFYPYYERCVEADGTMKKLIAIRAIAKDPHLSARAHEIASLCAYGRRDFSRCVTEGQKALEPWKRLKEIYTKPYYRTQLRVANALFWQKKYEDAKSEYLKTDMVAYPRVVKNLYDPRLGFMSARRGDCSLRAGIPVHAASSYMLAESHWLRKSIGSKTRRSECCI